jgi:osmotically inducible protein OsmC
MSLANEVGQAGGTPHGIEVSAEVDLGPDPKAGGFILTEIRLTGTVEADDLDDAGFDAAVKAAEAGCPVSKALASVKVVVDVTRA